MTEGAPRRGRDYTHEIIGRPAGPPVKPVGKKSSRHPKKLLLLLLLLIIIGACVWFFAHHRSSPFSKSVRQSVSFPLYYPSQLPSGYYLDKSGIVSSGGIVSYPLKNPGGHGITVTEQATPSNFDASKIIGNTSIPSSVIPIGSLYNLSAGSRSEYMITTSGGTLLFLNATTKVPNATVYSIASKFQD